MKRGVTLQAAKQEKQTNCNIDIDHRRYKRWRQLQCLKSDARSTKYLKTAFFLMIIRGDSSGCKKTSGPIEVYVEKTLSPDFLNAS